MYMVDGKPIQVPYGRRNVNVTKLEMEDIVSGLVARIEALEALVKDDDRPKRGRPPKEAQE